MKKIISFSLWGSVKNYTIGAIRNAELAPKIYPDWVCRFYVDPASVPGEVLNTLVNLGCEVAPMSAGNFTATLWRFLPASDSDVALMLSRDTDSRLTERERIAVEEWLASGKSFHIIRDHPDHQYRIMAGMWGCRCANLRDMKDLIEKAVLEDRRQVDQDFLLKHVYPRVRDDCFIHDEFNIFLDEVVHVIPHARYNYEHIGGYVDAYERTSGSHRLALKRWLDIHG
jgi:hypothetical protein